MVKILFVLLFSFLATTKLVQVVSHFRHGARYHLNSLYDGNTTKDNWGELTGVGMRQHQTLGQFLRKEYIQTLGFLSPQYNRKEIQVYSTAVNRTIQSAFSQIYGIYPLGTGPRLLYVDKKYHLPPFSNKTDDEEQNFALPNAYQVIPIKFNQQLMKDSCLNEADQIQKNKELGIAQYTQMNQTYYPFIQKMISVFNLSSNATLQTMGVLCGDIEVSLHLGRKTPANFTDDDLKNIRHLNAWVRQFEYVKDLPKAKNKYKLEKILSMFDGRIKSSSQSIKWTFLSGHDLEIVPMFTDLNLSSSQCVEELYRNGETSALNCEQYPQFATSLIFQLHQDDKNNYTVKIRVDGKYKNLCQKSSTQCKYDDWKNRIKKNLGTDALAIKICGSTNMEQNQEIKEFKMPSRQNRIVVEQ